MEWEAYRKFLQGKQEEEEEMAWKNYSGAQRRSSTTKRREKRTPTTIKDTEENRAAPLCLLINLSQQAPLYRTSMTPTLVQQVSIIT